jgi:excisionase family DNA binding protein
MKVKKTLHLDPAASASDQAALVTKEVDCLLAEGKQVTVHIAGEKELLSPRQAAAWLGFSRQHIVRLIGSGEIPAKRLPHSGYWKIPLPSILAFEERRAEHDQLTAQWSRDLDAMGAPAA